MTIYHDYPTLMVIDTRTQCFAFQVDNSGSGGRFGIGFTRSFLEVRNHALAAECLASCRSAADQLVASISRSICGLGPLSRLLSHVFQERLSVLAFHFNC